MLALYKTITGCSGPALKAILRRRLRDGKEHPARLSERQGKPGLLRPAGTLLWVHAASVGEAQSALILIRTIQGMFPAARFLVTTGTLTSADLMTKRLPEGAIHQFYPLDHPLWVDQFLNHWKPDLTLWMESELWPNMLAALKQRSIPTVLVNARMSDKSFARWKLLRPLARDLLTTFTTILAQTDKDAARFKDLGATSVTVTDNLKYSADPLPHDAADLTALQTALQGRPVWVYASTHAGEEALACELHRALEIPNLLTIIVPRHPERRDEILDACKSEGGDAQLRGAGHTLPKTDTDVYIADTLGELGLFYRLSPLACIGRSFSKDGGGGHNPIEAAQLSCAVLTGPDVQFQQQIFDEMRDAGAAMMANTPEDLKRALSMLLNNTSELELLRKRGSAFAAKKADTLERVMAALTPLLAPLALKQCA